MPRTMDWRLQHAVDALLELDRAGLAWEFLRRNPGYREEFRQTLQRIASGEISEEAAMTEFSRRWGLSFRPRSRLAGKREPDDLAARADTADHRSCRSARWFFRGA
jgi:Proteobacterial transcriptional regulator-like domain